MSKESFDDFLTHVKSLDFSVPSSVNPDPWDGLLFKFRPTVITILEKSGISADGKLKGGKGET